ncbi:MAG: hypothetical protein OXN25_00390 [Candidatus Poribacteria bacterium]|nr:hypothetical protein [Candidatus Poribacteria bacterium]MYK18805.1 hypothetical protein [Candidatus Poribacteria bacterium]
MKKLLIGSILSVAFACGIFVYTEWDNQRFVNTLPEPPVVEQVVEVHTHPHSHEDPLLSAPSTGEVESDSGAEANSVGASTEQMSEVETSQVDEGEQTKAASQTAATWQTDDTHQHQSTRSPFGKKITRIEDMDPDELADMTRVSLLRQFGDIPEVYTFVALKRKKLKNQPLTLDEHIDFTAAQYHLWPDPRTKKTLEIFLEKRATEYPSSIQTVR